MNWQIDRMCNPESLTSSHIEQITLPSGRTVEVPKATVSFKGWSGPKVESNYGGKAVLEFDGKPVFAELVILRLFQQAGWQGVWVDTFGGKYRIEYWPKNQVSLPETQRELLQKIFDSAGSTKGCWDVFCWKDDGPVSAESKRQGKDQIRDTQRRWLEAAIQCGLPLNSFLVVEWSVE